MKPKQFEGVQHREVTECGIRMINEEERIVELSFSSETPVKRWGAFEILAHDKNAVMLDRINTTGCLLFNHDRDKVIGKIIKAEIKDKRGVAEVQFDEDDESNVIYEKVRNKSLKGVSVGYIVHENKREAKGQGESLMVTYTATKWEPLEISIVSVPADITVGVGRSIEENENGLKVQIADYQIKINQNKIKFKEAKNK